MLKTIENWKQAATMFDISWRSLSLAKYKIMK